MKNHPYSIRYFLALKTVSIAVLLILSVPNNSRGATTLFTFDNIPGYPTPVDSFGNMFPGITLSSQNHWVASYVNATDFTNISGGCLGNYGTAPLTIHFASVVENVGMDIGSGYRYESQTANIAGYLGGQLIFSGNFITHPDPSGAEEVHVQLFGTVDQVVLYSASGGFSIMMDNLSFTSVPEPCAIHLLFAGGTILFLRRRNRH